MTKTARLTVGLVVLLLLSGWVAGTVSLQKNSASLSEGTSVRLPLEAAVASEVEDVEGAADPISLGFNNAEQVVEMDEGTAMVWVAEDDLQFVLRSTDGAVTSTETLATGVLSLPALARSGDLMGVAWMERSGRSTLVKAAVSNDGGVSFGEAVTLGSGSGPSLAASGERLVATWHDDTDETATHIMLSEYLGSNWDEPSQVDDSTAAPLWASVAMEGDDIYVTWRDNRSGNYNVWLRRSMDGEWQDEQNLTAAMSGDPDLCVQGDKVAVAHHGMGKMTLLESSDGGKTFAPGIDFGNGFFAHLSCTEDVVAVAWESTSGNHKSDDKQVGWALYDWNGMEIGSGAIEDEGASAGTVHLSSDSSVAEFLWIKTGLEPLVGTLRHQVMALRDSI